MAFEEKDQQPWY